MRIAALTCVLAAVVWCDEGAVSFADFRFVTSIAAGPDEIAFGTTQGIVFLDRWTERWIGAITRADGLPDARIERVAYDDRTGDFLARTPLGSFAVRDRDVRPTFEPVDSLARDVLRPSLPNAAFGPSGMFVYRGHLSDMSGAVYPYSCVVTDDRDRTWVGVRGLGPAKYDPSMLRVELLPVGVVGGDVRAIARGRDGTTWFGCVGDEPAIASVADGTWGQFRPWDAGVRSLSVRCALSTERAVWFGTDEGLLRHDGGWRLYTSRDGLPEGPVAELCGDTSVLWVGTRDGLAKWDVAAEAGEVVSFGGRADVSITALFSDSTGVYMGTEIGAFRFAADDTMWRPFPDAPVGAEIVNDFDVVGNDVWMATSAAVWRVPLDGSTPKRYAASGELPLGPFECVDAGARGVWVGGPDGAFFFSRRLDNWVAFRASDGLVDGRVNDVLALGDTVWFGTGGGVTIVDQRRLRLD